MAGHLVGRDLAFSHGPVTVLDGVSLTVGPGARLGVLGPNGAGKSTLLRLLAGELAPARGEVLRHPPALRVGFLAQEVDVVTGETVSEHVARRTGVTTAATELDDAAGALAAGAPGAAERYDAALAAFLASGAADVEVRRPAVLADVGLSGRDDQLVGTLSGGQRARLQLATVLLSRFDVLLLDEPTNDLDLDGLALLEDFVLGRDGGLVVVSHDRAFLDRVVTTVVELDEHSHTAAVFPGGYEAYLHERSVARRHAEEAYERNAAERARLSERARRHRQWSASGATKAARKPPDNDKTLKRARVEGAEAMAGQAARAERALERLGRVDKPWEGWDLRLRFATAGRPGDVVASLAGAVVRRGDFTLGPVDLDIGVGDRVVLTGPNGSGKSTLLAALLGEVPLHAGTQRLGPSVLVGRLDQERAGFPDDQPLLAGFVAATGTTAEAARSMLAKVGLGPEHVARRPPALSPGERTRAVLAAFAVRGVNLLVLDEPTNHLDLPAVEQLEQALDAFDGTLLLVTHDRRLLEQVRATRRVAVRDGRVDR